MKLQMKTVQVHCLTDLIQDTENNEQTQELRLSDGMPDVGRVIGAWGQGILRSKEWHTDHILASGGSLIWVLYEPEGGESLQVVSSWIPFQFRWELPEDSREGDIRISLLTRFADARSVSPRKILIRAGVAARAEALVREVTDTWIPPQQAEFPVLTENETIRLRKESGEKSVLLDEMLQIPESVPVPEKMIYCTLTPKITENRVVGDKLVFRGQGILHMVYQSNSGQVYSWDFQVPYSQYVQLDREYGNESSGDICLCVTSMEADLEPDGKLRLKAALAAQYVICDTETFSYLKDSYFPGRELEITRKNAEFSVLDEPFRKTVTVEANVPSNADLVPDVLFLPDYPMLQQMQSVMEVALPGNFQMLYYSPDGKLNCTLSRWEGKEKVPFGSRSEISWDMETVQVLAEPGNGGIKLKSEMELKGRLSKMQQVSMITELDLGQELPRDSAQPSLILLRCGKDSLWDIAKRTGSTVEKIAAANELEGECMPGQLLLVPLR